MPVSSGHLVAIHIFIRNLVSRHFISIQPPVEVMLINILLSSFHFNISNKLESRCFHILWDCLCDEAKRSRVASARTFILARSQDQLSSSGFILFSSYHIITFKIFYWLVWIKPFKFSTKTATFWDNYLTAPFHRTPGQPHILSSALFFKATSSPSLWLATHLLAFIASTWEWHGHLWSQFNSTLSPFSLCWIFASSFHPT